MKAISCLAIVPALAGCGRGNDCTFTAQCQNNVLQTCHIATRKSGPVISTEDCGAEGAACVQSSANQASCVGTCDTTFVAHCSGDLLVYCDSSSGSGLINSVDCYLEYANYCDPYYGCGYGGTCVDYGNGNAQCAPY